MNLHIGITGNKYLGFELAQGFFLLRIPYIGEMCRGSELGWSWDSWGRLKMYEYRAFDEISTY